ncbi:MAG: asparagine synthase (glutamine-hydrolyzing) [Deltaproteobacteria bacterium]|nr:asparagine synthase (glutamine-hydrolyzing) [Deltaproteobacteria bacterium]
MCGLVGWFDAKGIATERRAELTAASAAIAHRGPDDDGFHFDGDVGIAFRRLSILDLSPAGHQPMTSADGAWTVAFNGEIYNFVELRRELQAAGCQFRSSGDTEVLVEALARWGMRTFERCNGMWAVLAWHAPSRQLYAVRDPLGIKPLYAHKSAAGVALASEIGALRAFGLDLGPLEARLAAHFVDVGELDICDQTVYGHVVRLRPGRIYVYREGREVDNVAYTDGTDATSAPWSDGSPASEARYVEAFAEALRNAVRLRLRADVPVGTCMSGGLDSTSIACLAADHLGVERAAPCRHAFTALFPEFDERPYIHPTLERCGALWHSTVCDDEQLRSQFAAFLRAQGEPVHTLGAFAGYLVMSMAARAGVKVLLNGQGADELLAGYPSTAVPYLRSVAAQYGVRVAWQAGQREFAEASQASAAVFRAVAGLGASWLPQRWLDHLAAVRATPPALRPVLSSAVDLSLRPTVPVAPSLHANLMDQQIRAPLPLYLRIEDANSSAFSLESRLPFLDPAVVALARNAPATLLRRRGRNKFLLREALQGVVPEVVRTRPDKMGFPVPSARWLRGPLAGFVRDAMTRQRLERRGIYRTEKVLRAVDELLKGGPLPDWLGRAIIFELWAIQHIDGAPS